MQLLIITDLDGTLLHPTTYSFEKAVPSLELISSERIPLIFCSSKTRAEIEKYRVQLDNRDPFISENGGGIFIPDGYFQNSSIMGRDLDIIDDYRLITMGKPYDEIRRVFKEIQENTCIKVKGFGDMSRDEVVSVTGLELSDAELAKQRDFDEPFIFEKGETGINKFLNAIEQSGYNWTQGRFYHILGDHDKGKAVNILKEYYKEAYGALRTIGIGDSFNDLPLLQNVDYPVLVQKEDGHYDERIIVSNLIKADGIGPEGWSRAVTHLIHQLR